MSSSDDNSSDSGWSRSSDQKKETKPKPKKSINGAKTHYRRRFVEGWLERFKPWIARDQADPEKSYCKACERRLGERMCHLKRHERTKKHKRNLQSYMDANGLLPEPKNLSQQKNRSRNVDAGESKFESIFMDIGNVDGDGDEPILGGDSCTIEMENANQASTSNRKEQDITKKTKRKSKENTRKGGEHLFLQIQKDRHSLMSAFNDLLAVEKKDKNNVDVYFESIISSVKALPPKLIVETKMRICQVICEMELRAMTENESNSLAPTILLSAPLDNKFIFAQQGVSPSEVNQVDSSQIDPSHDGTE